MEKIAPGEWAFTGGQAITLYQKKYGLGPGRISSDVDIVVPQHLVATVAFHLRDVLNGRLSTVPNLNTKQVEMSGLQLQQINAYDEAVVVNTHIDVLASSSFGQGAKLQSIPYKDLSNSQLLPPTYILNRKQQQLDELLKNLQDYPLETPKRIESEFKIANSIVDIAALKTIVEKVPAPAVDLLPPTMPQAASASASASASTQNTRPPSPGLDNFSLG